MTIQTKWHQGSRDVKFQAAFAGSTVTIQGKLGRHTCSDRYNFVLSAYPRHPHDRKVFLDELYGTFNQDPNLVGQASRHTDAMMRAMSELLDLITTKKAA